MFHVAICDDNSVFLEDFKNQVHKILNNSSVSFRIECFSNIKDFIQELEEGFTFHLLFLDIEFSNTSMDGISGADYIRSKLSALNIHIVFISGQPRYALKLFEFQPLQFLIKPVNEEILRKTIEKSLQDWNQPKRALRLTSKRSEITIQIPQILYVESFKRKKVIHCVREEIYSVITPFEEIFHQLEPYGFISPHKSYIINYNRVAVWHVDHIIMENGERIPISQSHLKSIQKFQLHHHLH